MSARAWQSLALTGALIAGWLGADFGSRAPAAREGFGAATAFVCAMPPRDEEPADEEGPSTPQLLDPAAWGSDHVDQPLPEYVEGGECLFCHRNEVGNSWARNRHNRTLRDAEANDPAMALLVDHAALRASAADVELLMGGRRAVRYGRRSPSYGQLELLEAKATAGRTGRLRLAAEARAAWDSQKFNARCAGCHATGVDPEDHTFVTVSLDCYVCHGNAPIEHSNDPKLMPLAEARRDPPRVVASICGQCHVRSGTSRSSGRPYPQNFVAGDNLFRDFQVDWSKADDPKLNLADRHVLWNLREIVLHGNDQRSCLDCHDVHRSSTEKHRSLADDASCVLCHPNAQDKKQHLPIEVHSELCEY